MHANATLTPRHRLKVAQLVVDDGWPISEVAARFQVSWPTVKRLIGVALWNCLCRISLACREGLETANLVG